MADLANMYTLLSPIQNGLSVLVQELEDFIKQTAIETVQPLLANSVCLCVSLSHSLCLCFFTCVPAMLFLAASVRHFVCVCPLSAQNLENYGSETDVT